MPRNRLLIQQDNPVCECMAGKPHQHLQSACMPCNPTRLQRKRQRKPVANPSLLALRHPFLLHGIAASALISLPAGQAAVRQPLQLAGCLGVGRGVPQHSRHGRVGVLGGAAQHALQQGQAVVPRVCAPPDQRALQRVRAKLGLRQRPAR